MICRLKVYNDETLGWIYVCYLYMHSAGRKVSKSDTIVNIIISADGPSRLGTTIQYEYHVYTTQVYGIYWGTYNNINANDDGANTHIRTNTLYTHTHTRARTRTRDV